MLLFLSLVSALVAHRFARCKVSLRTRRSSCATDSFGFASCAARNDEGCLLSCAGRAILVPKGVDTMKEHILAFGCEGIAPLLTRTFAPRKMAVKAVPLADYAQTVGALAGAADCLRTEEVYAGLPLGEPMLVFCGFYGDRMNQALNAMRRTGLRIPYKAMLTAANRGWRPAELFAELQKEHAAMTAKR